jgi:hypothetical protein
MKTSKEMQAFAIAGLDAEIARLTRLRQELVGGSRRAARGKEDSGEVGNRKGRKRRKFSAAERREISKRMKAMWAAKRAQK